MQWRDLADAPRLTLEVRRGRLLRRGIAPSALAKPRAQAPAHRELTWRAVEQSLRVGVGRRRRVPPSPRLRRSPAAGAERRRGSRVPATADECSSSCRRPRPSATAGAARRSHLATLSFPRADRRRAGGRSRAAAPCSRIPGRRGRGAQARTARSSTRSSATAPRHGRRRCPRSTATRACSSTRSTLRRCSRPSAAVRGRAPRRCTPRCSAWSGRARPHPRLPAVARLASPRDCCSSTGRAIEPVLDAVGRGCIARPPLRGRTRRLGRCPVRRRRLYLRVVAIGGDGRQPRLNHFNKQAQGRVHPGAAARRAETSTTIDELLAWAADRRVAARSAPTAGRPGELA